jgi:hypothetical protein
MFRPNINCIVYKSDGTADVYGMPLPGIKLNERCSIIKLNVISAKSAIRADTSASRGNARELEADTELLMTVNTAASIDDLVSIDGSKFLVVSKFPRHDLQGNLDHYQVTCSYWSVA